MGVTARSNVNAPELAAEPEDLGRLFLERASAGDVDGVVALYEPEGGARIAARKGVDRRRGDQPGVPGAAGRQAAVQRRRSPSAALRRPRADLDSVSGWRHGRDRTTSRRRHMAVDRRSAAISTVALIRWSGTGRGSDPVLGEAAAIVCGRRSHDNQFTPPATRSAARSAEDSCTGSDRSVEDPPAGGARRMTGATAVPVRRAHLGCDRSRGYSTSCFA